MNRPQTQTSPQQGTASGQSAQPTIPITPQNYPVLNRWMELEAKAFEDEVNTLAALGREASQPDTVQRAVQAAASALEALYRRRSG